MKLLIRANVCVSVVGPQIAKICMVEKKQIMKALRDDKHKVINVNENDDIYAACKCSTRFHKFAHIDSDALPKESRRKLVAIGSLFHQQVKRTANKPHRNW